MATKPGVYFNLADLTVDLPSETKLRTISGINNHGDMIGRNAQGGYFLLERVGG
ncbi:hypothetical protein WME90_47510 [Sorangium sp. So ce375]|uniref:hypothetical protein n=1 Tax=Sorangium sp. So ce375 TaxID=3133306 RepID=UPI003F5C213E